MLSIYNNGFDHASVLYEHTILLQLNKQVLSFQVPKALQTRADPSKTYAVLTNGADACFFKTIPRSLPKLTCVREIRRG
jgi:hypothetical protein